MKLLDIKLLQKFILNIAIMRMLMIHLKKNSFFVLTLGSTSSAYLYFAICVLSTKNKCVIITP